MKAPLLFLGFFLFLESCSATQKINSKHSTSEVSFRYFDNRILVPIFINGAGPFHMIFDTGGSNMLVPEVVARLKLQTKDAGFGMGAGDKKRPMQIIKVDHYKIGSFQQNDQDFLVMDLNQIKRAFNFPRLDGIIGYELLKQYVVTINYDEEKLNFTKFENFKSDGVKIKFNFYHEKPVIASSIEGIQTEIMIDTGDRSAFTLFKKFSKANDLNKQFNSDPVVSGYGVGGPIPAILGQLSNINLGKNKANQIHLKNVPSRLPLTKSGFFAKSSLGGSLGNGVLQQFVVSFNYRDKEMIVNRGVQKHGKYKFIPPVELKP